MKKIKIIAIVLLIITTGIISQFCSTDNNEKYVALVNGEGISLKLFRQQIDKNRALVYDQFGLKYDKRESADFWYTRIGRDDLPAEVLKRKALDECVRIKIQMILAKRKGILSDISYDGFLKKLNKVNSERKLAVSGKKIVYGPTEYTEGEYFDHLLSITTMELKERLTRDEFPDSDINLKKFYESKKDELFKVKDSVEESGDNSFEKIKLYVRSEYINYEYEQLIKGLVNSATIKINDDVYNTFKIE